MHVPCAPILSFRRLSAVICLLLGHLRFPETLLAVIVLLLRCADTSQLHSDQEVRQARMHGTSNLLVCPSALSHELPQGSGGFQSLRMTFLPALPSLSAAAMASCTSHMQWMYGMQN